MLFMSVYHVLLLRIAAVWCVSDKGDEGGEGSMQRAERRREMDGQREIIVPCAK